MCLILTNHNTVFHIHLIIWMMWPVSTIMKSSLSCINKHDNITFGKMFKIQNNMCQILYSWNKKTGFRCHFSSGPNKYGPVVDAGADFFLSTQGRKHGRTEPDVMVGKIRHKWKFSNTWKHNWQNRLTRSCYRPNHKSTVMYNNFSYSELSLKIINWQTNDKEHVKFWLNW